MQYSKTAVASILCKFWHAAMDNEHSDNASVIESIHSGSLVVSARSIGGVDLSDVLLVACKLEGYTDFAEARRLSSLVVDMSLGAPALLNFLSSLILESQDQGESKDIEALQEAEKNYNQVMKVSKQDTPMFMEAFWHKMRLADFTLRLKQAYSSFCLPSEEDAELCKRFVVELQYLDYAKSVDPSDYYVPNALNLNLLYSLDVYVCVNYVLFDSIRLCHNCDTNV